jgi:hypothetical protein
MFTERDATPSLHDLRFSQVAEVDRWEREAVGWLSGKTLDERS